MVALYKDPDGIRIFIDPHSELCQSPGNISGIHQFNLPNGSFEQRNANN